MIAGAGSNIGVQIGDDGVVVVDAGSSASAGDVLAAIQKLTPRPIRYIIDTSADPDHVGGNETLSKAGQTLFTAAGSFALPGNFLGGVASILSAEKVLSRMSAPTGQASPFPAGAWPTETFDHARKYMFLNGEGIEVLHQPAAHTDGDVVVFFRRSDVVVAGDILDTTRFPVIDVATGRIDRRRDRRAQPARRPGDSVGADRLARGRHDRDSRARAAVRSARRRGIPRHGQHHSRSRSRSQGCRHDPRPDQGRVAGARVHAAIRIGFRVRGRPINFIEAIYKSLPREKS